MNRPRGSSMLRTSRSKPARELTHSFARVLYSRCSRASPRPTQIRVALVGWQSSSDSAGGSDQWSPGGSLRLHNQSNLHGRLLGHELQFDQARALTRFERSLLQALRHHRTARVGQFEVMRHV